MRRPDTTTHRTVIDLGGIWTVRFADSSEHPFAVPGTWNTQIPDHRDDLGPAVCRTTLTIPADLADHRLRLWFGSVNYLATVSIDGIVVATHEGGHLPFWVDLTGQINPGPHVLEVEVDGELRPDRVPPGDLPPGHGMQVGGWPPAAFDFFPFAGILRPVLLEAAHPMAVEDVEVTTSIDGTVTVSVHAPDGVDRYASITGHGTSTRTPVDPATGIAVLKVGAPRLWGPRHPDLYDVQVSTVLGDEVLDEFVTTTGIREVQIDGDRLLLNGEQVVLRGFGRHEDLAVLGRTASGAAAVLDHDRMAWCGANSYRTSHYPYDEQQLELADRLGFLVISETPAVGLYFVGDDRHRRSEVAAQQLRELIARDRNHPSVIMWSLANEPISEPRPERSIEFFQGQHDLARALDPTRPTTVVGWQMIAEPSHGVVDVVSVNLYNGWYTEPGRIEAGAAVMAQRLDSLHDELHKPVLLAEFGTDALAGHHADPPEMWSEEYQADFIEAYLDVVDERPWMLGAHVWNLCDFATSQGITRAGAMNHKGIFTRDRRPKLAAHRLRARWRD